MPPPGVPDWVFPGAVIIGRDRGGRPSQNRAVAGHWVITNLDLSLDATTIEVYIQPTVVDDDGRVIFNDDHQTITIEDLLTEWQPTGEWLYSRRPQGPAQTLAINYRFGFDHGPDYVPPSQTNVEQPPYGTVQPLQFYRWSFGALTSDSPNRLIFVTSVAGDTINFDTVDDEAEHTYMLSIFHRELANGNAEFLGHESIFHVPNEMEELYHAGDLFLDGEGREFFLTGRTREANMWIVRAAHDMRDGGPRYIQDAQRVDGDFFRAIQGTIEDHGEPEYRPFESNPGIEMMDDETGEIDYPMGEEDIDPVVGLNVSGDIAESSPALMIRVGDRWHFNAPNLGIWTLETRNTGYSHGRHTTTNTFRSDDGARMNASDEWIVTNGRRISPPDPRFTGDVIAPRQVWEIPMNVTRRNNSRWTVTKVAVQASVMTVSLMPEPGPGTPIYWPEVRLRAQGRFITDGVVRRTAFERIIQDDDP